MLWLAFDYMKQMCAYSDVAEEKLSDLKEPLEPLGPAWSMVPIEAEAEWLCELKANATVRHAHM